MKKNVLTFVGMIAFLTFSFAQDKYITKNGKIDFEASVAAFEPIKAEHENVTGILNTANGEVAALALMRGFRFDVALMEEHFNENYIESNKYPKATFRGKLKDFSVDKLTEEAQEFALVGTITMREKAKKVSTMATVSKKGDVIYLKTNFDTKPEEFNIDIPKIVNNKISETIGVIIDFELNKK